MLDCITGRKNDRMHGCILADGMGLGKTLQAITTIYTMLAPYGMPKPLCQKALVLCPASLVGNWEQEFQKWLQGRCHCRAVTQRGHVAFKNAFDHFESKQSATVLVLSYESARLNSEDLIKSSVDLVICDEAHRLKNPRSSIAGFVLLFANTAQNFDHGHANSKQFE